MLITIIAMVFVLIQVTELTFQDYPMIPLLLIWTILAELILAIPISLLLPNKTEGNNQRLWSPATFSIHMLKIAAIYVVIYFIDQFLVVC